MAEQSRRELPPAVPTTRKGHAAVPAYPYPPEVRRGSCRRVQSFQPGPPPLQPNCFSPTTRRHPRRMACAGGWLKVCRIVSGQTFLRPLVFSLTTPDEDMEGTPAAPDKM